MKDWIEYLRLILTMNQYTILAHAGKISDKLVIHQEEEQYVVYHKRERQAEHLDSIRELDRDLKVLKS